MSISSLFAPNPYNLYCNTITPSAGIPAVDTNNIDAVNPGDTLNIGAVKAGAITLGSAAIFTNMPGPIATPLINVDIIQARTPVVMQIGANAAGISIMPALGNINVDDASPSANVLSLGAVNIGSVDIGKLNGAVAIGKAGGTVTFGCPVVFPGGGSIATRVDMAPISAAGQGCFTVPQAGFVLFEGYKENGVVFLRWRFTGVTTAATATSTLVMGTQIPAGFRPISTLLAACTVVGTGGQYYPGQYTLQPSGVHGFQFVNSTHLTTSNWDGGASEPCAVEEGSIMFTAA